MGDVARIWYLSAFVDIPHAGEGYTCRLINLKVLSNQTKFLHTLVEELSTLGLESHGSSQLRLGAPSKCERAVSSGDGTFFIVATPPGEGPFPVVIIIHEFYGLNKLNP